VILPTDDFYSIAEILRPAKLAARDFSESIGEAKDGDFLYVDSPYTVRHNNNSFLRYNEHIFSWSDQRRLAASVAKAAKNGACVLVSNANHRCIRDLYRDQIWQQFCVSRLSLLASSATDRNTTTELVVSNYLDGGGRQVEPRY